MNKFSFFTEKKNHNLDLVGNILATMSFASSGLSGGISLTIIMINIHLLKIEATSSKQCPCLSVKKIQCAAHTGAIVEKCQNS